MKNLLLGGVAILTSVMLNAQGWLPQGARSAAMGNSGVTVIDAFSYHHNPGALGFVEHGIGGIAYEARYLLKDLQSQSFAVAVPLKVGVISTGGQFYGYEAYRTTRVGVGYSMKLWENISAGIQLNYVGMRFGSSYYGKKDGISAEFGALAKVTEKVNIGFSVMNISRSKLADFRDERWGTILRLGVSYQLIQQLLLVAEFGNEIGYKPRFRVGLEYHPIDLLYIRAGLQSGPMEFTFGFGLEYNRFKLDLASRYSQVLGFTPAVSFIVDFYHPKEAK